MIVDVKKFTALIAFNDDLRNEYYDIAEAQGINSTWDVYHIQEGTESPNQKETAIMQEIYDKKIAPFPRILEAYSKASDEFRGNVRKKIERLTGGREHK